MTFGISDKKRGVATAQQTEFAARGDVGFGRRGIPRNTDISSHGNIPPFGGMHSPPSLSAKADSGSKFSGDSHPQAKRKRKTDHHSMVCFLLARGYEKDIF